MLHQLLCSVMNCIVKIEWITRIKENYHHKHHLLFIRDRLTLPQNTFFHQHCEKSTRVKIYILLHPNFFLLQFNCQLQNRRYGLKLLAEAQKCFWLMAIVFMRMVDVQIESRSHICAAATNPLGKYTELQNIKIEFCMILICCCFQFDSISGAKQNA